MELIKKILFKPVSKIKVINRLQNYNKKSGDGTYVYVQPSAPWVLQTKGTIPKC